jgi:hypothetical protein
MHILGQRHELVLAQLLVAVLIELLEQLFRLRQIWRRTIRPAGAATWTAWTVGTTATFSTALAIGPGPASFAALTTTAITRSFPHLFAGLFAFFVIQLAVFIGVKFLEHPLFHFLATRTIARILVFIRPGQRRQR